MEYWRSFEPMLFVVMLQISSVYIYIHLAVTNHMRPTKSLYYKPVAALFAS